jgi:hypothetical protein
MQTPYKPHGNPLQAFFAQIYSEAQSSRAAPGHHALAELWRMGALARHYTLNIDGLAEVVGMDTWHHQNNPGGVTVEMHGNIRCAWGGGRGRRRAACTHLAGRMRRACKRLGLNSLTPPARRRQGHGLPRLPRRRAAVAPHHQHDAVTGAGAVRQVRAGGNAVQGAEGVRVLDGGRRAFARDL